MKRDLEKIALQIFSAPMNLATGIETMLNRIQSEVNEILSLQQVASAA